VISVGNTIMAVGFCGYALYAIFTGTSNVFMRYIGVGFAVLTVVTAAWNDYRSWRRYA